VTSGPRLSFGLKEKTKPKLTARLHIAKPKTLRAFQRIQKEWLSLLGRRFLGKFSLQTILESDILSWSIDAAYVNQMGRLLIISFFVVRLPILYGTLFSAALGSLVLCLIVWRTCFLVGGRVVVLGVLLYGRWFPYALFRACGGKVTIEILKTKNGP
jgi:hypothetical protein